MMRVRFLILAALAGLVMVTASGCAKNVDRIEFEKWGNSFLGQRRSAMDTTAQGGGIQNNNQIPLNNNYKMPKASVGGTYHRTFATSPSYRMLGGFHTH